MINFENRVIEEAATLTNGILGTHSGDSLNHLNAIFAIEHYLDKEHPLFDALSPALGVLPASHGMHQRIDIFFRFSTAALIGRKHIEKPSLGMLKALDIYGSEANKSLEVNYLFNIWRSDPFKLCQNPYLTYLFGQYVARLHEHCEEVEIKPTYRTAIVYQMIGATQKLFGQLNSREMPLVDFVAQVLLATSASVALGELDRARDLLSSTQPLDQIIEELKSDLSTRNLYGQEFDQVCFIGINAFSLKSKFPDESQLLLEFVDGLLRPTLGDPKYDNGDLRRVALRLAGLRCVMPEPIKKKVVAEFEAGMELKDFLEIRNILLSSVQTRDLNNQISRTRGADLQDITPEALRQLANKIEYQQIFHTVMPPWQTLRDLRGDCKALSALLSMIILENGKKGNLCIVFGQDMESEKNNHMFVEWVRGDDKTNIPIDFDALLKEFHQEVDPDLVLRFPLSSLVQEDYALIVQRLAEHRIMIRQKIRNRRSRK